MRRIPASIRIAAIYVLVATVWILGSDRLILGIVGDPDRLTSLQSIKGIVFVLLSGLLIGGLVARERARWLASEQATARLATRFESLFRSNPAGTVLVDLDTRRFLDANERFLELFGYERDELVGRPVRDVELWADPDELAAATREVLATGQVLDRTGLVRRADGSIATMIWSAERVRSGGSQWLTASVVDISDRTRAYEETLEGWARALDLRDNDTAHHSLRVTRAAELLARRMGLDANEQNQIRRGALLHDIGKIGVPDAILHKPGPLTDEEWDVMRQHPVVARDLLAPIGYLHEAMAIPVHHHERWDGSGYPDGLVGEDIPLAARIFAVVDVWDALTSDRPYRAAWSEDDAFAYLEREAGHHLDPRCVAAFLAMMRSEDRPTRLSEEIVGRV